MTISVVKAILGENVSFTGAMAPAEVADCQKVNPEFD